MVREALLPKTNELFVQIEAVLRSNDPENLMAIKRLERQAEDLMKADAAGASIAKSGIAALRWDTDRAMYWIENALIYDKSVQTLFNASVTLRMLNEIEKAIEFSARALQAQPAEKDCFGALFSLLCMDGQISRAIETSEIFQSVNLELEDAASIKNMLKFQKSMRILGITEKQLQKETKAAFSVLKNNKIRISTIGHMVCEEPDGGESLVVELCFNGTIEQELRYEAALADILSEDPEWNPCVLSTEISYMSEDALLPA